MTLLDAAWQALEALEYHVAQTRPIHQTDEAITDLRQAIEQAEQQEPVAWIEHIAGGVEYNPYHKAALKLPEGMRFDLYTTPPQRKPLTEEQLELLWDKAVDRMEHFCSQYWDFARAIERAHGIGGGE